MTTTDLIIQANRATASLAALADTDINALLLDTAAALRTHHADILEANRLDLERMDPANPKYDRLLLTEERIHGIASDMEHVATLPTPLGITYSTAQRPNGMIIRKVSVPFGVIGIIYESRPNVTADAFGLCFKTGNAVILKGGSDAIHSNIAIANVLRNALKSVSITEDAIQMIEATDRAVTAEFMKMNEYVDVLIPRGGKGLIQSVVNNSTVPVIRTGEGN